MDNVDKIQKNIEGSMAIEGAIPSDKAREINREFLEGRITSEDAIKKIKNYWLRGT